MIQVYWYTRHGTFNGIEQAASITEWEAAHPMMSRRGDVYISPNGATARIHSMNDILAREVADAKACLAYAIKHNLPMEYVEYWRQRVTDLQGE